MSNKRNYLNDMKLDDSGEYNYRGDYYALDGKRGEFMKIWIPLAVAVVAVIVAGIFPAPGASDTWYVILPFGLTIAMGLVIAYHMFKLCNALISRDPSVTPSIQKAAFDASGNASDSDHSDGTDLVREYVYQKTWPRLIPMTKFMIISGVVTLIAEVAYIILNTMGSGVDNTNRYTVTFVICIVICVLASIALLHRYNGVKWQKIAKNSD